ncbi:complexed with cef1p [Coemansia sp. S85]|nr:complexed with cef1p [Coemansia sp. S85]
MTTAARPTFDPAKGQAPAEFTYLTSAKDLPSHTKLKTRRPGQGTRDEYTIDELKRELAEAEEAHFRAKRDSGDGLTEEKRAELEEAKTRYIEMAQRLDAASDEDDGSDEDDDDDDGDGESEESEDETAMLMRELEKIKRERAEEKAREEETVERAEGVLGENPLLSKRDFSVKRRWDDDVVFKNQALGDDGKTKKRFVNDMLRSDFHRKFMKKYIH